MATFLDELSRINASGFLSGVATIGEAMKESKQNKALVQLYEEFKTKREGLQTTDQQLSDFSKVTGDGEVKTDISPDTEASFNAIKTLDRMGALSNVYQPFISAFATLGDDGVRLATTLSRELEQKLTLEEKRGDAPLKELRYQREKLDLEAGRKQLAWDEIKQNRWQELVERDDKVAQLLSKIRTLSSYTALPDTAELRTTGQLKIFEAQRQKAIDDAKQRFGDMGYSDEEWGLAIDKAYFQDKKINFNQYIDTSGNAGSSNALIENQASQNMLGALTEYYREVQLGTHPDAEIIKETLDLFRDTNGRIDKKKIGLASQMVANGQLSERAYNIVFDPQKGYYNLYRPGGTFLALQNAVAQKQVNWYGLKNQGKYAIPSNPGTENIMRVKDEDALINGGTWEGGFNPLIIDFMQKREAYETQWQLEQQKNKSTIPEGKKTDFWDDIWDEITYPFTDPSKRKQFNAFENIAK